MLQFRLNSYALTSKYLKTVRANQKINVVFVHGFTMHDASYPVVDILYKNQLIDFYKNSSEHAHYLKKQQQLEVDQAYQQCYQQAISTPNLAPILAEHEQQFTQEFGSEIATFNEQGNCNFGNFITISLDYSDKGIDASALIEQLKTKLGNRKTLIFSFSYGVILTMTILDLLHKDNDHSYFNNIVNCYGFNGSFLPYDDELSIISTVALDTAKLWRRSSLVSFSRLIGLPDAEIQLLRRRVSNVSDQTLFGQKQTLVSINNMKDYYKHLLTNPKVMSKWHSLVISNDDKIFPVNNLIHLAKLYNLPAKIFNGEHYIAPVKMVEMICSVSKYETI